MAPASAPSARGTTVTKSGIATSATGDRVIPASTRADGSQRREIRVRPGYRPPEDVEVYRNRTAEAFRNREKGGVPGAEALQEDENKAVDSKSKNAKRREARKRAKAAIDLDTEATESRAEGDTEKGDSKIVDFADDISAGNELEEQLQAENEKRVKRLKKKLREARELQAKKEKGEGLLHEQFEKVIKINELMRELEKLGVHEEETSTLPPPATGA